MRTFSLICNYTFDIIYFSFEIFSDFFSSILYESVTFFYLSHLLGSQAASLMADAPSELEHMRSVLDIYLNGVKERIKAAVATLDDAEYKELK